MGGSGDYAVQLLVLRDSKLLAFKILFGFIRDHKSGCMGVIH